MSGFQKEDAQDVLDFYVKAQEKQINDLNSKLIILKTKNTYLETELRKEKAKIANDEFLRKMAILKRHNKNLSEENRNLRNEMDKIEETLNNLPQHLRRQLSEFINIEEKKPVRRGGQLR